MRTSLRAAAGLALLLAACSSSRTATSAGVVSPTSIVTFNGVTARHLTKLAADGTTVVPDVRTYVAVSSGKGTELRLIDPQDDRPILGPTLVFPLSIPTVARPLKLASAPLGDGGADLLAVAVPGSSGPPVLELVETWATTDATTGALVARNRIAGLIDLAAAGLTAGDEILSLRAVPLAAGARLVAGISSLDGGRLVVVDFQRGAEGQVVQAGAAVSKPLLGLNGLRFDPLDLAFSASGAQLFVATTDPLATDAQGDVFGVAQLDGVTGDASLAWPLTPLDARVGTTAVATASVLERTLTETDAGGTFPATNPDLFAGSRVERIYAVLDRAACGDVGPIRCGVATLVPGAGLASDPTRDVEAARTDASGVPNGVPTLGMDYRAPLEILGVPVAVATAPPVTTPVAGSLCAPSDTVPNPVARERLAPPGPGQRCTTATAVILSSDANAYVVDLGRFQVPSETAVLNAAELGTAVTSALATGISGQTLTLLDADGAPITQTEDLAAAIQVSPGFTPSDSFAIVYQGVLPGFEGATGLGVAGVIRRLNDGTNRVVLTGEASPTSSLEGLQLGSVELAVRSAADVAGSPGESADFAQILTDEVGLCAGDTAATRTLAPDAAIAEVLRPGTAIAGVPAGGALVLPEGCYSDKLAAGEARDVHFQVRAGGLLLSSTTLGYLGRPRLDVGTAPAKSALPTFKLQYDATADQGRARAPANEAQLLARKARRRFYPADYACARTGCTAYPQLLHPLGPAPVVAFSVYASAPPARDAAIDFATRSGYRAFATRPSGAMLPVGAAAVDRSKLSANLEIRWYAAYSDDQVFVFGPAEAPNQAFSIR